MENPSTHTKIVIRILRLASFTVFFGRGYQHVFFDVPFRALLWDQSLLGEVIPYLLNISWYDYVTSLQTDWIIQTSIFLTGIFYLICAVLSLVVSKHSKVGLRFIKSGGLGLFVLSLLYFKEHFFEVGQLLEMTGQWSCPLFLYYCLQSPSRISSLIPYFKISLGLTFLGHALYALGVYPVPGHFLDMVGVVLGLEEKNCRIFLKTMGQLDILVFFVEYLKGFEVYAFAFACFWGLLTSMARLATELLLDFSFVSFHHGFYESLYRLPHFFLPLLLLSIFVGKREGRDRKLNNSPEVWFRSF